LQLLKKEKYGFFPANIELEYRYPAEIEPHRRNEKKCLAYCKDCLA